MQSQSTKSEFNEQQMIQSFRDSDSPLEDRKSALESLIKSYQLGKSELILNALIEVLQDENDKVKIRELVCEGLHDLKQIDNPNVFNAIVKVATQGKDDDENAILRENVANALGSVKNIENIRSTVLSTLIEILIIDKENAWWEREAAIKSLGQLSDIITLDDHVKVVDALSKVIESGDEYLGREKEVAYKVLNNFERKCVQKD